MNCTDAAALLESFHDGELDGRRMRDTAVHLAACEACTARLADHERVNALLSDSVGSELDGLDADRIWAGVEEGIAEDIPAQQRAWQVFRLAAATTKVRGIGPKAPAPTAAVGSPADEAGQIGDTGEIGEIGLSGDEAWLHAVPPDTRGGATAWIGGGMALAAGVMLSLLVFGGDGSDPGGTIAAKPPSAANPGADAPGAPAAAAKRVAEPATVVAAATAPAAREPAHQVQIHSLNDFGGEMAMWAEPAGDTAVIWLGDGAPRARR